MKVYVEDFDYYVKDNTLVVKLKVKYEGTWLSPLRYSWVELRYGGELIADDHWIPPLGVSVGTYEKEYEFNVTAKPGLYEIKHLHSGFIGEEEDFSTVFRITQSDIGIKGTFDAYFTRSGDVGTLTVEVKTDTKVEEDTRVVITVAHETWDSPKDYITYIPAGHDSVKHEITYNRKELPDGRFKVSVRIGNYNAGEKTFVVNWESGSITEIQEPTDTISRIIELLKTVGMLIIFGVVAYVLFKFVFPIFERGRA